MDLDDLFCYAMMTWDSSSKWKWKSRIEAKRGDPSAQYYTGINCLTDGKTWEGIEWLRRAAQGQNIDALEKLARLYDEGEVVTQNPREAFKFYYELAMLWEVNGRNECLCHAFEIAERYAEGKGVVRDDAMAFSWYCKVAKAGNTTAIWVVAEWYEQGRGCERDVIKAVEWYSNLATIADVDVYIKVTNYYINGVGSNEDYAEFVKEFASSCFKYYNFSTGAGMESTMRLAEAFYIYHDLEYEVRFAYEYSFPPSVEYSRFLRVLGLAFEFGLGVFDDQKAANAWYTAEPLPAPRLDPDDPHWGKPFLAHMLFGWSESDPEWSDTEWWDWCCRNLSKRKDYVKIYSVFTFESFVRSLPINAPEITKQHVFEALYDNKESFRDLNVDARFKRLVRFFKIDYSI